MQTLPSRDATPGPAGAGTSGLQGRRVLSWREFARFDVSAYERGEGEGSWQDARHRLLLCLTPRPAMAFAFDGAPRRDLPPEAEGLMFLPAGVAAWSADSSSRYARLCWEPGLLAVLAPHLSHAPSLEPEHLRDPLLAQLLRTLAEEAGASTLDRLLAESLLAAAAVRLAQRARPAAAAVEPGLAPPRLRRVLDHIEAHLGEDMSLEGLAAVACLSPFHFSRSFKAATGEGPRRYVLRRRVERAKAMLRQTSGRPLAAIAAELGFADQSHLTNAFRRETGTTPARFRSEVLPASS